MSGGLGEQRDINMKRKRYIIKKIAYANNTRELEDMFPGGETVYIELQDEILDSDQIGFITQNGKGDKMVSKVR